MTQSIHFGFLVVLLTTTQGCLMVPFPNRSTDAFGVVSQVVDAQSGLPVPHAQVYAYAPDSFVEADGAGRFQIEPLLQWHAGYIFGAVSFPIWPFTTDAVPRYRSFRVVAIGYKEEVFAAEGHEERRPDHTSLPAEVKDDKLYVPRIQITRQLQRKNGDSAAP